MSLRTTRAATLASVAALGLLLGGVTPTLAYSVPSTAPAETVSGTGTGTGTSMGSAEAPESHSEPVAASHGAAHDGTIAGRVLDPRGLAGPNEKFTVIALQGRSLTRVVGVSDEANEAGEYLIDGLPRATNLTLLLMSSGVHSSAVAQMGWPNSYDVRTFETLNLDHGDAVDINFTLQPGFADMCLFSEFCNRFYKEIMWMRASGLSTGVRVASGSHGRTTQHYMPRDTVTREAMAAFLYRLNTPKGARGPIGYTVPAASPFADVPTNHKFFKEIAWMHESGLSTGIRRAHAVVYAPKSGVSREAMAAFMYRMEHPNYRASSTPHFADVPRGHKFFTQIQWMFDSGLSTGVKQQSGKPKYLDQSRVSREAMAAFLYRSEH